MVETSVVRDVSTPTSITRPVSRPPPRRSTSVSRSAVTSSSTDPRATTAPSGARHRVHVLDPVRQQRLAPRRAAVARAERLTAAGDAVGVAGVVRIERERHHRGAGLDAVVQARPALAEIGRPVERAVLAAGGRAQARVERAGIVGRDADVTGGGQRREATHLHVAPAPALVVALEQTHAYGQEDAAGRRGADG